MLKLIEHNLSSETQELLTQIQTFLANKQKDIDQKVGFEEQKNRAITLWDGKKNSKEGKTVFATIKKALNEMSEGFEVCQYCEHDRNRDIEHIYPKSFFPNKTFCWENYLLVCPNCNLEKSNKLYVHVNNGSKAVSIKDLSPPYSEDIAFINPRREDPSELIYLSFDDFLFYSAFPPQSRFYEKVEKTLEVLALNDSFKTSSRENAFVSYKRFLVEYVAIKNAMDFDSLNKATDGIPPLDESADFQFQKQNLLTHHRQNLNGRENLSVLKEMLRRRDYLPSQRLKNLIDQVPELYSLLSIPEALPNNVTYAKQ